MGISSISPAPSIQTNKMPLAGYFKALYAYTKKFLCLARFVARHVFCRIACNKFFWLRAFFCLFILLKQCRLKPCFAWMQGGRGSNPAARATIFPQSFCKESK